MVENIIEVVLWGAGLVGFSVFRMAFALVLQCMLALWVVSGHETSWVVIHLVGYLAMVESCEGLCFDAELSYCVV